MDTLIVIAFFVALIVAGVWVGDKAERWAYLATLRLFRLTPAMLREEK
jgi:hypothetical protein